jgi:hypothetical protein
MGDLESLLLVVVVIYLTECLVWVRRGAVAVRSHTGRRWRVWHPGAVFGNSRGALLLANPLPPFGVVVLGHQFSSSVSPDAIYSYTAASVNPSWRPVQIGRIIRHDALRALTIDGRRILANGEPLLVAPSASTARHLGEWLHGLKSLPQSERAAEIRGRIADALDAGRIRARWAGFEEKSRLIHRLSILLFVYLFLIAPALLWYFGIRHAGIGVGTGLVAQTMTIGFLFRRAHRALFPEGSDDRFAPFLTMLLAPPTAIRARDFLARHLVEEFHPLAVAEAFCPQEEFKRLARHVLLDLQFPMLPVVASSDSEATRTEHWFRSIWLEEVEKAVVRAGLELTELRAPPAPTESVQRAYCPRCGAQFVSTDAVCGDCGGRALVTFEFQAAP